MAAQPIGPNKYINQKDRQLITAGLRKVSAVTGEAVSQKV
jgi:hypothetical protein